LIKKTIKKVNYLYTIVEGKEEEETDFFKIKQVKEKNKYINFYSQFKLPKNK
jgi:hypothetical protein